ILDFIDELDDMSSDSFDMIELLCDHVCITADMTSNVMISLFRAEKNRKCFDYVLSILPIPEDNLDIKNFIRLFIEIIHDYNGGIYYNFTKLSRNFSELFSQKKIIRLPTELGLCAESNRLPQGIAKKADVINKKKIEETERIISLKR